MPDYNEIMNSIREAGSVHDIIRREYIKRYSEATNRNTIIYYSGWLHKPQYQRVEAEFIINDDDKISFMTTIHNMDRSMGLDLFLHTPGGEIAATESLVDYLRAMFDTDIRVIVPQLAQSAGTMMACASKTIIMGKHSSLGPIDPQIAGLPAHGIVEEFQRATEECLEDQQKIPIWQSIIGQYFPTLVGESEKAIAWAAELVKGWLVNGMFKGLNDAETKADHIIQELSDHTVTKTHSRHISADSCRSIGLNVKMIEELSEEVDRSPNLQDLILSIHHSTIATLTSQKIAKLVENQLGIMRIAKIPNRNMGPSFLQLAEME